MELYELQRRSKCSLTDTMPCQDWKSLDLFPKILTAVLPPKETRLTVLLAWRFIYTVWLTELSRRVRIAMRTIEHEACLGVHGMTGGTGRDLGGTGGQPAVDLERRVC
jgi:hypothetical protein